MSRRDVRRPLRALVLAIVAVAVAACGIGAAPAGDAGAPVAPAPTSTTTPGIAATTAAARSALGAAGLQLSVPQVPYRPAESPTLAAAPRAVYQVKLPNDQDHGYFVVYDLGTPAAATAAAQEQVAYVQSGPGRVQFPTDARFVLRQLGSTLVFYAWSPSAVTDPGSPDIATALGSIGTGYAIQG